MALTDRPDISLNEFQVAKTGLDLDVRYQKILSYAESLPTEILEALVTKFQVQIGVNNSNSAGYGGS